MIQVNFSPFMDSEIHRRHEEIIKQAEMFRMANEMKNNKYLNRREKSNVLAKVGKKLADFGNSLHERYGGPLDNQSEGNLPGDPEGCS